MLKNELSVNITAAGQQN